MLNLGRCMAGLGVNDCRWRLRTFHRLPRAFYTLLCASQQCHQIPPPPVYDVSSFTKKAPFGGPYIIFNAACEGKPHETENCLSDKSRRIFTSLCIPKRRFPLIWMASGSQRQQPASPPTRVISSRRHLRYPTNVGEQWTSLAPCLGSILPVS